jgi:Prohead core protein serine protease
MKFLRESAEFNEVKIITEGISKDLFIEGIFAQAEKKNRNGRVYEKGIMEGAVNKYVSEFVQSKRALGELSHPENRPTVKPEFASHLITKFQMEGNDVIGKAKILNTPQGQIAKGLLEGGVQLGVSTRGLGSVTEREGTTYVGKDFMLTAVDIVGDPSGIDCWVNAVNESAEWLITDDGRIIEKFQKEIKKAKITEEVAIDMFSRFLREIKSR